MSFTLFQEDKTPFQAIKTSSSKSRKIDIFPKGLTKVLVQKWPFFEFFFQAIQTRKMFFTIFLNEKTSFYSIKTRSPKTRKIYIFLKGLTHGFSTKMAIFPTFIFQAIQTRKMSFTIFQNEKTLSQAIKTKSPKVEKLIYFPRG